MLGKRTFVAGVMAVLAAGSAAQAAVSAASFDLIETWIGSGSNQSALVIDWHDGKGSVTYGYRWDGTATGADLLRAAAAADAKLVLFEGDTDPANTGGDTTGGENTVYGIGYDHDGDGFTLVPGASDSGAAADADDSYGEGWFVNYWGYFVNIDDNEFLWSWDAENETLVSTPNPNYGTLLGDPYDGGSWGYAGKGFVDHELFDGSWDGWGFGGETPAIPEPASALLIGLGSLLMLRRRR